MKLTHPQFKSKVDHVLDECAQYQCSGSRRLDYWDELVAQREELKVVGLKNIAFGGHGPTWAKTTLRLYE